MPRLYNALRPHAGQVDVHLAKAADTKGPGPGPVHIVERQEHAVEQAGLLLEADLAAQLAQTQRLGDAKHLQRGESQAEQRPLEGGPRPLFELEQPRIRQPVVGQKEAMNRPKAMV